MKPSIPKGTRDFLPAEITQRNYVFNLARTVFKKYGFVEIETPTMESLATLTGKYGEEGDRLLFKILNNGDFLAKADKKALEDKDSYHIIPSISKRGLRYDLTVPFARYVVMHQNSLQFPFKRFQIQPVWRADRPQKGRYQEFYQCDADMIGSDSLVNEAELIKIVDEVFSGLSIDVEIKVNNRKILYGIAECLDATQQFNAFTVAIDKFDKIGLEKVLAELQSIGFHAGQIDIIKKILGNADMQMLKDLLKSSETGWKGIAEIESVWNYLEGIELKNKLTFDPKLARGLNYYTGCIFEVKAQKYKIGSVAGGGRYDDLTGSFGLKGMSGVGISFGAERIYDIMVEGHLFPQELERDVTAIVICLDEITHAYGFKVVTRLRNAGIAADIYPDPVRMKKQMKYANARSIPYALIIGSEEMKSEKISVKNLKSGEQELMDIDQIIEKLLI